MVFVKITDCSNQYVYYYVGCDYASVLDDVRKTIKVFAYEKITREEAAQFVTENSLEFGIMSLRGKCRSFALVLKGSLNESRVMPIPKD
jgi:hypothetical protein